MEDLEQQLIAVFSHYDLPEPRYGEHPFKCPVHDDAHASASVNRDKGLWHCHACGAGGSAVNLIMAREQIEYPQAAKLLTSITGGASHRTRPASRSRRSGRWIPPSLRNSA